MTTFHSIILVAFKCKRRKEIMTERPLTPRPCAHYSTEQLNQLKDSKDQFHASLATDEILRRAMEANIIAMGDDIKSLKKPHWTLVPIFWFTLAALLISLVAYFLPPKADVRDAQSNVDHQTSETISVSSSPTPTGKAQKSKPETPQKKP